MPRTAAHRPTLSRSCGCRVGGVRGPRPPRAAQWGQTDAEHEGRRHTMEARDRGGAVLLGPGEGLAVRMSGAQLLTRKVGGARTGGAFSLFEVAVQPGGGQAPHIQHEEDECFYVLEGRFAFLIERARTEAGPGSLLLLPQGKPHKLGKEQAE